MRKPQPLCYEIRVVGHLDERHASSLESLSLRLDFHHGQPITIVSGFLADQSALYGVLNKLQAMGVVLLGVVLLDATRLEPS